LALSPPFSALASLSCLAFARSVAVSGYRRSSGPGGSALWYCTISLDHCSVLSASSKSRDLVSVLHPSYFSSIGHTLPLPHLVFVPWLGYSQHPPTRLGRPGVRPPFTSLPPTTRGLSRPNPPHVLPLAPLPGSIWLRYYYLRAWLCSVISILWAC